MIRRGGRNWRSTAAAAAAFGGATMAPSAIAAASGRPANFHPIKATAAVVTMTAMTASEVSGSALRLRSRGEVSKAASTRTGVTNKASAQFRINLDRGREGQEREHGA